REAQSLGCLDDPDATDIGRVVFALAGMAVGRGDQAAALVIAQRLDVHPGFAGNVANPQPVGHAVGLVPAAARTSQSMPSRVGSAPTGAWISIVTDSSSDSIAKPRNAQHDFSSAAQAAS